LEQIKTRNSFYLVSLGEKNVMYGLDLNAINIHRDPSYRYRPSNVFKSLTSWLQKKTNQKWKGISTTLTTSRESVI